MVSLIEHRTELTLRRLRTAADECRSSCRKLEKISGEMEEVLVGDAGTALIAKFEEWKARTKEIRNRLEEYANQVEQAALAFEEADNEMADENRKHASAGRTFGSSGAGHSGGGGRC